VEAGKTGKKTPSQSLSKPFKFKSLKSDGEGLGYTLIISSAQSRNSNAIIINRAAPKYSNVLPRSVLAGGLNAPQVSIAARTHIQMAANHFRILSKGHFSDFLFIFHSFQAKRTNVIAIRIMNRGIPGKRLQIDAELSGYLKK
jgi:hypothetical protein